MKISLFLTDRLVEFTLPNQVSGSYSFDVDGDETDKIINIEARNGKWVLYSTDSVFILNNNNIVPEMEVTPNMFYVIRRNNQDFTIYITDIRNRIIKTFSLTDQFTLTIGSSNEFNICYSTPYLKQLELSISRSNNAYVLTTNLLQNVYINNKLITNQQNYVNYCDNVNVMGLKMLFTSKYLVLNIPTTGLSFNNFPFPQISVQLEEKQNIIVKEKDLYDSNNYFSKSPRIRRLIELKDFSFDGPPKLKSTEKTPLILTLGPMLSLLASSGISLLNTIVRINEGVTTFKQSWVSFATCGVMLTTSFVWPLITKAYNKRLDKKNNKEIEEKYGIYLKEKEKELENESNLQKSILFENLLSCKDCLGIVNAKKNNFWCKRKDQNDFLQVRVGIGEVPLALKVNYPKDGFTLEEDKLKKMADDTLNKYKILEDVPVGYSLYENYLTAVMGPIDMCNSFINNLIFQLVTFYCYDEIKFIVFTDDKNKDNWEYLKYSKYCFSNNQKMRYFATNNDEYKELCDELIQELQYRLDVAASGKFDSKLVNQYYIIICDNYKDAKRLDFFKKLVEAPQNVGYSTIFIDNRLSNLPSKCVNFITLNKGISGILNNSYESATVNKFKEEISNEFDMDSIMRDLSNVPVEIKDEDSQLPNSIGFLEMEKVGKVGQLNILNRWSSNNSVKSLKAEIGVDADNDLIYLDLHEKAHGPHGLIAGMTGSGKSEFIITYILSMCMNYSPDDISFVLIDYKGGGLAGAFLNQANGIRLPHLAGTITNLDKAEMNRTLVSIDSEIKRRQTIFNEARDLLAESTIDIYKYQDFYHQGKLKEAIPHLFIICDEFAELKSQQPQFMDNLISVARIGRSLGVHLVLATQKPSGVVNDQIWSNSKFRVCLKVQDASDSNEMLKKPDAANIKQTGRFYLQVGYDELFVLGQSAWCGAKYFPSEKVTKTIDKSVNVINNIGSIVKSAEDDSNKKLSPQGEQIGAVLNEIITVSKQTNKVSKMLWLENIPDIILIDNIIKKYGVTFTPYNVEAVIGEYDAPELQRQGIVKYNLMSDGNTLILGTDGTENEMLLNSIIYSVSSHHSSEEVNFYLIDYGSESLRIFGGLPHLGGIVTLGDDEKYVNLIRMMREETIKRKELFVNYGGEYKNYLANSGNKLPLKVVIINNYDAAKANIQTLYDELPELVRDSERYGIIYIITANGSGSVGTKVSQSFTNAYCLHLKDVYDYSAALGVKTKIEPKEILGRGVCAIDGAHEFQTASIVEDSSKLSDFIIGFVNNLKATNSVKAKRIPALPAFVSLDDVDEKIKDFTQVPIGISKDSLEIKTIDMIENVGNLVLSNKIENTTEYANNLIQVFKKISGSNIILVDSAKGLLSMKDNVTNYYDDKFSDVLNALNNFAEECLKGTKKCDNLVVMFYGLSRLISKLDDKKILESLFKNIKKTEKICVVVFDEAIRLKSYAFDMWFKDLFANQEGIWIGSGIVDQSILKISSFGKEFRAQYKNNMGFYVSNGEATLIKLLDFNQKGDE